MLPMYFILSKNTAKLIPFTDKFCKIDSGALLLKAYFSKVIGLKPVKFYDKETQSQFVFL